MSRREFYRNTNAVLRALALCLPLFLFGAVDAARGQSTTAALNGAVQDEQGARIPGVAITLIKSDGLARQTVISDSAGAFSFGSLPSGSYRLLASRHGFAVLEESLELPLAAASLDVKLKLSAQNYSVTVTAANDSFAPVDAISATRIPLPIDELPQSVGIVNRAVMDSEQALRIADAARNVSGVERDAGALGDVANLFTIRGITLDTFNSYFRDGYRYEGGTPTEVADVAQFEILKGPASMVYGRTEPGGIVNLVTVKPLAQSHQTFTFQADRFGLVRPQFDSTGPLTSSGNLLYRVVGLYGHTQSFRDYVSGNRYFLAPQLLWRIRPDTSVSVEGEYLYDYGVTDSGIPSVGDRPAPIPISRFLGEPWNRSKYQAKWAGATFNHRFNANWNIRNGFRATFFNWYYYDVYSLGMEPDNRTLDRGTEDADYPRHFFDNQTDVAGTFATGRFRHTVLLGFEAGSQRIRQIGPGANVPSIDIYQPLFASLTRPPHSTSIYPDAPGYYPLNALQRFTSFGWYAQDQIAFGKFAFNAAMRVEDYRQRFRDYVAGTSNPQVDNRVVPRVGGIYHVAPRVSLYASFSQSFSPAIATMINESGKPFKPELGTQYEAGVRWSALSGRLSLTSAAYRIRVSNVLTANPGNPLLQVQTGLQQSKGFEFDVNGKITSGWNVLLNYTFMQATILQDNTFPVGNLLPNAPRHAGNVWTVYEIQRGRLAGLGVGGGVFSRSKRAGELTNSYFMPGYARVDATAFYSFGHAKGELKRYRLAVSVQNLLDRRYYETGRTQAIIYPGSPVNALTEFQVRF